VGDQRSVPARRASPPFGALTQSAAAAIGATPRDRSVVDDPKYLMLDLELDTADRAEAFAGFLLEVWSSAMRC
jgi:hypothetical protein